MRTGSISATYKKKELQKSFVDGPFFGLTFFQSKWGNVNFPTRVSTQEELIKKFGMYYTDDEVELGFPNNKNDWYQAYNFLEYTKNLKIFRVAKQEPEEVWAGFQLKEVHQIGNANKFLTSIDSALDMPWHQIKNGKKVFYRLNDWMIEKNIPNFPDNHDQLVFVYAKYPGILGNDLRITVYNHLSNIDEKYVFSYDSIILDGSISGIISVGDTIETITPTKSVKAIVKQIDTDINKVFYELISKQQFDLGDMIEGTTLKVAKPPLKGSDTDEKILMTDLFDSSRQLNEDQIYVVISMKGQLLEYFIASLDANNDDFLENKKSDYVGFYISPYWIFPSKNPPTLKRPIVHEYVEAPLLFGASDACSDDEILEQLEKLKNSTLSKYDVLFSEHTSDDYMKLIDSIMENKLAILNSVPSEKINK